MQKKRKRPCRMVFWTTYEEKQMIIEHMEECNYKYGTDAGAFLRKMAINGFIVNVDRKAEREEIKALTEQIRRIGININQIAKKANETESIYQGDIEYLKEMMKEIWRLQRSNLLKQL